MSKFKVGDKVIFKSQPPTLSEYWNKIGTITELNYNLMGTIYPCLVKIDNKWPIPVCSLDELILDNTDIIKSLLDVE